METKYKLLTDLVKQNAKSKKFTSLVSAVKHTRSLLPKVDTKSFIALPIIYK